MNKDTLFLCIGLNIDALPFSPGNETLEAIGKTSLLAKDENKTLYIFEKGMFLYATDKYPGRNNVVAVCYPGGRMEYRKVKEPFE